MNSILVAFLFGLTLISARLPMIMGTSLLKSKSSTSNNHYDHNQNHQLMNPAVIKGYKFFDSITRKEIVIRGIDYYPRPNAGDLNHNSMDLYTEEYRHIWERDIQYFEQLGINAIRLYAVDSSKNHDSFMCALQQANIYVIVALAHDCPTCAITRDTSPTCYPKELKQQGQDVINTFSKYSNTLAFSAGNEVNHFAPIHFPQSNSPCQKKFISDMRRYISQCSSSSMRKIPVGLVTADSDRDENAFYYNCIDERNDTTKRGNNGNGNEDKEQHHGGGDEHEDEFGYVEWYGLNSYLYCSGESLQYDDALGFQRLETSFNRYNYSIPVLLTEFGCLSDTFPTINGYEGQRTFLQAKWILGEQGSNGEDNGNERDNDTSNLRDLFSGGFAFEYSIEKENAGGESPYPFKKAGKQNYGIGTCSCVSLSLLCFHPTNQQRRSLTHFPPSCCVLPSGYFSPENCDDIDIPCKYNPFPEFENLKYIYRNYTYTRAKDDNVTMDTFEIPLERRGRSKCPDGFPSIYSFEWEADKQPFGSCPKPQHHQFQCSATGLGNRWNARDPYADYWIWAGVFCSLIGVSIFCFVFKRYRNGCQEELKTRSIDFPFLHTTFEPRNNEKTEESWRLLSKSESGDTQIYDSIGSNSSSSVEDL